MDEKYLKKMKKILEKELSNLEKDLERVAKKKGDKYRPLYRDYGVTYESNAAEFSDFESNLALERNILSMIEKTKKALLKIEKGTYGICEKCGKEISKERLEALPQAIYCIKCQRGRKWLRE